MSSPLKTEGIVLHIIPYKDYDQIVTLLTLEHGLISIIAFGSRRQKSQIKLTPLLQGEFILRKGKNALYICEEISVISYHLEIRDQLNSLTTASEFISAIRSSQLAEKPVPALYQLLIFYLKKLSRVEDHTTLCANFLIKVLLHEGLLGFSPACCHCQETMNHYDVEAGESYCAQHLPLNAITLSTEDIELIIYHAQCQSYSQIFMHHFSLECFEKVKKLFHTMVSIG